MRRSRRNLVTGSAASLAGAPYYTDPVVIDYNNVHVNGDRATTAEEYAGQAAEFADRGRSAKPADNQEFPPLGAFGLIQGDEQIANHILQLAVNKEGVNCGNCSGAVSDNTLRVYGSADRDSQRAAWSTGEKEVTVFEARRNDLTQDQTTVLAPFGTERTQQMVPVRLERPRDGIK
jgi:hypothetical protein